MSNLSKLQKMMVAGTFSLVVLLLLQLILPTTWLLYAIVGSVAVLAATLIRFRSLSSILETVGATVVLTVVFAIGGSDVHITKLLVGRSADMIGGFAAVSFWDRLIPATMVATSLVLAIFALVAIIVAVAKGFSLMREKCCRLS